MTVVEIGAGHVDLTFRQRWSHYFALIFGLIGMVIGINLRDSTLHAATTYTNPQAGIIAEYPQNWLLDESDVGYIFRVRDMAATGFKTAIQVATQPISPQTSARNVFDSLTLARAQIFAAYNVINETPFQMPDGSTASSMSYSFVNTQVNPFLQDIPTVVQGIDILIVARGQAIVISYLAEAARFDENLPILEQFLRSLTI